MGYPVHAGIDLNTRHAIMALLRLPRTRGDRPLRRLRLWQIHLATPYTRGSTSYVGVKQQLKQGYPVHAGIDPKINVVTNEGWRLPRTRGDRPNPSTSTAPGTSATPYTRGSTHIGYCQRSRKHSGKVYCRCCRRNLASPYKYIEGSVCSCRLCLISIANPTRTRRLYYGSLQRQRTS